MKGKWSREERGREDEREINREREREIGDRTGKRDNVDP